MLPIHVCYLVAFTVPGFTVFFVFVHIELLAEKSINSSASILSTFIQYSHLFFYNDMLTILLSKQG
jgi:hypothetical protein